MISYGADDYNNGLLHACRNGHTNIALLMLTRGAWSLGSGLRNAFIGGYRDTALLMIESGAKYDWNKELTRAYDRGHKDIALLMIEQGANIDICEFSLSEDDICYLIWKGITNFGKYQTIVDSLREAQKNELNEFLVMDVTLIVLSYIS